MGRMCNPQRCDQAEASYAKGEGKVCIFPGLVLVLKLLQVQTLTYNHRYSLLLWHSCRFWGVMFRHGRGLEGVSGAS